MLSAGATLASWASGSCNSGLTCMFSYFSYTHVFFHVESDCNRSVLWSLVLFESPSCQMISVRTKLMLVPLAFHQHPSSPPACPVFCPPPMCRRASASHLSLCPSSIDIHARCCCSRCTARKCDYRLVRDMLCCDTSWVIFRSTTCCLVVVSRCSWRLALLPTPNPCWLMMR